MGNYKGAIIDHGVPARGCESCVPTDYIQNMKLQPGCAVQVTLNGRGEENQRKMVLAWVEEVYPFHFLLRVDTPRGPYRFSVNKVDLVMRKGDRIREVV